MALLEKTVRKEDFFYKKDNLPILKIGDTIKVAIYLELPKADESGKEKERIQIYEGVIISKHSNENPINATITVRKMFQGGGIEKVFLTNSPWVKEIKVLNSAKVRRGKLYFLRERMGKSARLKRSFS
jgi:large subunit ribosomal protein L19